MPSCCTAQSARTSFHAADTAAGDDGNVQGLRKLDAGFDIDAGQHAVTAMSV